MQFDGTQVECVIYPPAGGRALTLWRRFRSATRTQSIMRSLLIAQRMKKLLMLFAICLFAQIAIASTLTGRSTGKDWARHDIGSDAHRAFIATWFSDSTRQGTLSGHLVEQCLDAITTDEKEQVPKSIARQSLDDLAAWCFGVVRPHLDAPAGLRGKSFQYPSGLLESRK